MWRIHIASLFSRNWRFFHQFVENIRGGSLLLGLNGFHHFRWLSDRRGGKTFDQPDTIRRVLRQECSCFSAMQSAAVLELLRLGLLDNLHEQILKLLTRCVGAFNAKAL